MLYSTVTCQVGLDSVLESPQRDYHRGEELEDWQRQENRERLRQVVDAQFPHEEMEDSAFRDKVMILPFYLHLLPQDKERAVQTWMMEVLEDPAEAAKARKSSKKASVETQEELPFILQSGVLLCKLAKKIVPECGIAEEQLQTGTLAAKRSNISLFLEAASTYGVPEELLFQPDDLATHAHVYRLVTVR